MIFEKLKILKKKDFRKDLPIISFTWIEHNDFTACYNKPFYVCSEDWEDKKIQFAWKNSW